MSQILSIAAVVLAVYLVFATAVFLGQRSLIYLPSPEQPDPADTGLENLTVAETPIDGELTLRHWYVPAKRGNPVLVVFQGNAGHMGHRVAKFRPFLNAGHGLFLTGYRGYSGNPGRPSETGLLNDGRAALDWLKARGVPKDRIVLYGESLGTGVAVPLAAERDVAVLVLEAPFTSLADVAQWHYWYLPARWLIRDRFESKARIGDVQAPLLILHGEDDRTIPLRFGRRLFEAANEPKTFHLVEEGDHLAVWDSQLADIVLPFLEGRVAAGSGGSQAAEP